MAFLILNFCFFGAAVVTHLFWCRYYRSSKLQVAPFFCISLGYLAAGIYIFISISEDQFTNFLTRPFVLSSITVYSLLIPTYLIFYAATVIDSPSKKILRLIRDHDGLRYVDLHSKFQKDEFVISRLNSLQDYQLIDYKDQIYRLLPRGVNLARMLSFFKRIFGHAPGG